MSNIIQLRKPLNHYNRHNNNSQTYNNKPYNSRTANTLTAEEKQQIDKIRAITIMVLYGGLFALSLYGLYFIVYIVLYLI